MDIKKTEAILVVSFFTLIIIPLLYIARSIDDNTFTSWRWVFSETGILRIFFFIAIAILCSFFLSRLPLPEPFSYIFLFALSFTVIMPVWKETEPVIDASRYFVQAKLLKEYGINFFIREWGHKIDAWTDMPLLPFVYGLIFKYLGETRVYIQIFNTLLFASTSALAYFIGKTLWDEETGFHAGLLLLGIPYLLSQTPLMLVDIPTMFFLTLSIYAFINALNKGGYAWIAASSISICLAIFSKYSTLLMLPVIPLIFFVYLKRNPGQVTIRASAITAITIFIAGIIFYLKYDVFTGQIEILRTYQMQALGRWKESFMSTFLFQIHPFITIAALYAVYRAAREKDRRFLIALWFAVFVFILQIKRIRYIMPLFPLFTLMASYGINEIKDRNLKRFISFCIAGSSIVIALWVYLPFLNKTGMGNLKEAGQYLNSLNCEIVEVYALPQKTSTGNTFAVIPILDYFTDKKIASPQEWSSPSAENNKSPLRFTWEMRKPDFYSDYKKQADCPLLIISSEPIDRPLQGIADDSQHMEEVKRFYLTNKIFRYQTFITLFKKQ